MLQILLEKPLQDKLLNSVGYEIVTPHMMNIVNWSCWALWCIYATENSFIIGLDDGSWYIKRQAIATVKIVIP